MIKLKNTRSNALQLAATLTVSKRVPVFDMDGVFADARHRQICKPDGSLDLDKYRENSTVEKIARDSPLPMIETLQMLSELGVDYHICTARVVCTGTEKWLENHGITPKSIMSRCPDRVNTETGERVSDTRKDFKLKETHLRSRFHAHDLEKMVLIDDNLANCRMAERNGMLAINVPFIGH